MWSGLDEGGGSNLSARSPQTKMSISPWSSLEGASVGVATWVNIVDRRVMYLSRRVQYISFGSRGVGRGGLRCENAFPPIL